MKRAAVIKKIKTEAKRRGVEFAMYELTNHTGIRVGSVRTTLKRHAEIDDTTARLFFDQFAGEFGKGWW